MFGHRPEAAMDRAQTAYDVTIFHLLELPRVDISQSTCNASARFEHTVPATHELMAYRTYVGLPDTVLICRSLPQ